MADRSQAMADRFERAVAAVASTVEGLSESQWQAFCPNEGRSVGVLSRHVPASIPFEMAVFRQIASGQQPPTITRAQLDKMNARDAEDWADCPRDETLTLLRHNAAEAAAEVRHLRGDEVDRTGMYIAELTEAWTVEQWLQRLLIGHIHEHLDSILEAVATEDSPS